MSLMVAVAAAGCPGCPPTGTKGGTGTTTTTTPASSSPLDFTASDTSPKTCVFSHDTGASSVPTFTLKFGGKGITVSASYPSNSSYDPPGGTMQITYDDSSTPPEFDSGQLALSPAGSGITVTETPATSPTSWSMTAVKSGAPDVVLNWGKKWKITFSCGATPNCCANTQSVHVVADGTF